MDRLSMVHHGRTRKHCQLYRSYGDLDNERLVLQYGFASAKGRSARAAWKNATQLGDSASVTQSNQSLKGLAHRLCINCTEYRHR